MSKIIKVSETFPSFQVFRRVSHQKKHFPVLRPRFKHLKAYSLVVLGRCAKGRKSANKALKMSALKGNMFEENWLKRNQKHWFQSDHSIQSTLNEEWKEHAESCWGHLNLGEVPTESIPYTLPVKKTK